MPISYRLEDELLDITVEGDHEMQDLFDCVDAAQRDPDWSGSAWLLIDVRQSPAVTRRTPQEIRKGFEFMAARPGRFRHCTALLVSSALQREVLRMNEVLGDFIGSDVRIFYDRDEAVDWLRAHERSGVIGGAVSQPASSDTPSASR